MLIFNGEPTIIKAGDIAKVGGYNHIRETDGTMTSLNIAQAFLLREEKLIVEKKSSPREHHILTVSDVHAAHVTLSFVADCCGLGLKRREDLDDGTFNFFEFTAPKEVEGK